MWRYLVFLLLAACFLALIPFFRKTVARKREESVRKNSKKLRLLKKLNQEFQFNNAPPSIELQMVCSSKSEFDYSDYKRYLLSQITKNRNYFFTYISMVNQNRKDYQSYLNQLSSIRKNSSDIGNLSSKPYFQTIEENLIAGETKKPTIVPAVQIIKTYVSPQGRRSYREDYTVRGVDLIEYYNKVVDKENQRQLVPSNEKERSADTPQFGNQKNYYWYRRGSFFPQYGVISKSRRYDVMKRDHYRCVLCGASAKDGAKLDVEYIFPLSKGGKAIMSNLRTICDKCSREISYKNNLDAESRRLSAQYERKKMTPELREAVKRRDGYRCVLCGASAKDGAQLEVDHIQPVSKGGKTEMDNLRTLCKNCNRGKRDKYDPFGLN